MSVWEDLRPFSKKAPTLFTHLTVYLVWNIAGVYFVRIHNYSLPVASDENRSDRVWN